ncbi:peptidoglycan DD-metalloendopeptidase family protein [Halomonas sp. WWR20]
MRKTLWLVPVVALGLQGCATSGGVPEVRDLSASHTRQTSATHTVKAGETLYGIAWQANMDFRELAQLNGIKPPYRLQSGQVLQLQAGAGSQTLAADDTPQGVVMTPLGGEQAEATGSSADWLAPDESAIERNRRLTRQTGQEDSQPSSGALAAAAATGGAQGPGPVYDYASAGSSGELSSRERAEQAAIAQEREASTVTSAQAPSTSVQNSSTRAADTPVSSNAGKDSAGEDRASDSSGAQPEPATQAGAAEPAVTSESRASRTYTPVKEVPWQWPVSGEVIGRFNESASITAGIDIAGEKGQPVKAAGPGIVVYAGSGVRGYGNLIILKHNDHFLSAYAHNESLRVEENDVVEAGETIATMGQTDADRVKLHFEVRQDGQPQDPLKFLPSR